jgi:UDP-N-acetylglucosamine 2-epimerase (non-hydrolysing)
VDSRRDAENTVRALEVLCAQLPVVLPLHPRTRSKLDGFGLLERVHALPRISIIEPQGYLDFLALMDNARVVLTDSGGVQEETTALGVPCLTFRENTERPITVTEGTNQLIGLSPQRLAVALDALLSRPNLDYRTPELWDGRAAQRILDVLQPKTAAVRIAA